MERETELKSHKAAAPPVISTNTWGQDLYYFSKRIVDILVSFFALILLSPFMLAIAALIHFDSPGPILFTQKRVGAIRKKSGGQTHWTQTEFTMYKFRTMVDKADPSIHRALIKALIEHDEPKIRELTNADGRLKKLANDRRITRCGRALRSTSLDELPQFWNVLKGEMSLTGPRPAIPYEVELYKPWYFRRFAARPGLTGLWQVSARNAVDFDEMIRLDIQYVDHQSLWLDLKIIVLTPLVVLVHRLAA